MSSLYNLDPVFCTQRDALPLSLKRLALLFVTSQ